MLLRTGWRLARSERTCDSAQNNDGDEFSYHGFVSPKCLGPRIPPIAQTTSPTVSPKNLDAAPAQRAALDTLRQVVKLAQGIPIEKARAMVKAIKDAKMKKVQASIQGDTVRISGPKRDVLQECIAMLKEQDFGLDLNFGNFRD